MIMRREDPVLTDATSTQSVAAAPPLSYEYDPDRVYTPDQLLALDILVQPLWIFDSVERRMRWANKAGLEMWNAASREELQSRSFKDMSESSVKRCEAYMIECSKGRCITDDWTLYPKGKAKTVHMNVSGLRMSHDDDHISMICQGIPYLKEELMNDKTRGVEMLRHLPLAVCQFDMQGKVMYQNPEAMLSSDCDSNTNMDETGETSEEDTRSCEGKRGDEDNDNNSRASASTTSTSSSSSSEANRMKREAGGLLNRFVDRVAGQRALNEIQSRLELNLEAELKTRAGPKVCVVQMRKAKDPVTSDDVILFSALDNSDAQRAEEERVARERKSEFLAIMAHEIRTPLHQVTGFIDLLDQTTLTQEQQSFVNLLKTSAQGLMTVINDVLDYSKLEAGKMKIECIPYEPLSVAKGSIAAVRQSCDERQLYLRMEWDSTTPFRIQGDPNRLRQILLNLLSNAVKFTKEGGICVRTQMVKDNNSKDPNQRPMLQFMVKDTGVGLSAEQEEVVFRKYQQANASIARQFGGTGLGLSICQLLTQGMGGTMGVESELGKGSCFWFRIPAELPSTEKEKVDDATKEDGSAGDMRSLHVLVAEDNKVNQKLLVHILKRLGHSCDLAENGQIALKMIQERDYDCCLMDIQMPTMDGLEATRRLRSMGYTDLPIFGLTASVARSDYKELGFNDWIAKPVPMKDLRAKLSRVKVS